MKSSTQPADRTQIEEVAQAAADTRAMERVRHELLGRIAGASTARHLTIHAGPEDWQPFTDGIECKVLREEAGTLSYLLRLRQVRCCLPTATLRTRSAS